jgi:hypothetical protein
MMKSLLTALVLLCVPAMASAQGSWTFDKVFPDSTTLVRSAHGLAVDNAGKVWVAPYYETTVDGVNINWLYAFNPDGTQAFPPIDQVMIGDSIVHFGRLTGLNRDVDGNILVSSHGWRSPRLGTARSWSEGSAGNTATTTGGCKSTAPADGCLLREFSFIAKFNATTGAQMWVKDVTFLRIAYSEAGLFNGATQAPNRVAVTADGQYVVSFVFGGSPLLIYTDDRELLATVTNSKRGFSRTLEVSADGKVIYNPSYDSFSITQYIGVDGVFSDTFTEYVSPMGAGMATGAAARYPANEGVIYFSGAGGGNDPNAAAPWNSTRFYGLSAAKGTVLDSLSWNYGTSTTFQIPRSIAFAQDGLTAYVGTFSLGRTTVQKFTRSGAVVSVEEDNLRADGFALSQNYPNPFNPSTSISYTLPEAGMTTLKVYDMLGREVATLVNGVMSQGTHNVMFNAANLGSGIYLYELRSGNTRITNKMTLMK